MGCPASAYPRHRKGARITSEADVEHPSDEFRQDEQQSMPEIGAVADTNFYSLLRCLAATEHLPRPRRERTLPSLATIIATSSSPIPSSIKKA